MEILIQVIDSSTSIDHIKEILARAGFTEAEIKERA